MRLRKRWWLVLVQDGGGIGRVKFVVLVSPLLLLVVVVSQRLAVLLASL
jgi:hypothetical protein